MLSTVFATTFVSQLAATCATASCEEPTEGTLLLQKERFAVSAVDAEAVELDEEASFMSFDDAIVPRLLASGQKCTSHADLRTMGAWRYGQNGTSGDLAKCALLVHQVGASYGCLSGIFHFTMDQGLTQCGCATSDHCASKSQAYGWDVHTLTSYVVLPDGRKSGVDEGHATHFPVAPANVPKIWDTKGAGVFKVAETSDCGIGYEPIMNVDDCRRAGNALNIQPWPFHWLPLFNAFCSWAWGFPPASFKLGDIVFAVPAFDPGCLVGPGMDRGKKLAYFEDDVLLFNTASGGQVPQTFIKNRICKKSSAYAKGVINSLDGCPQGTSNIRDKSACMEAIAKFGLVFNGIMSNEFHYPAGCIYQINAVHGFGYFNDLPFEKKGHAISGNVGPLCG